MIDSQLLVSAYASGWFPMAVEHGEIRWFSPDPRGIIPLETFSVSRRLARRARQRPFDIAINSDFAEVVRLCAEVPRDPEDPGTWITDEIVESYCELHVRGLAHSVECWHGDRLAGGLYGVSLGGAFFGESMFHRETDASKIALIALVERLKERGYVLLDTQWTTPHLEQFGAIDIPRREYLGKLERALKLECAFD